MANYDIVEYITAYRKDTVVDSTSYISNLIGGYPIVVPVFEWSEYNSSNILGNDFDASLIPDNPLKLIDNPFPYTISFSIQNNQDISNPLNYWALAKGNSLGSGLQGCPFINGVAASPLSTIFYYPLCIIKTISYGYFIVAWNNRDSEWDTIQIAQYGVGRYNIYSWTGIEYVSFKLLSPDSTTIYMQVGDSVELKWGLELQDGTVIDWNDVIYESSQDSFFTIENNVLTLTGIPPFPPILITASPNIEGVDIFSVISIYKGSPYQPNPPSGSGGGGGNYGKNERFDPTVNLIPNGSTVADDSASGMYTRYVLDISGLYLVGQYFWSEELGLQVAKTIISLLYGDPIETVISCVFYPFQLLTGTGISSRGTTLHWGGFDSGVSVSAINGTSFQIDWGSIQIDEYWGNFLDYSPHTQIQLYLPWGTGFVSIDPNDILKSNQNGFGFGTISVKTNIELSRGLCIHHVIANDSVIGSYSGSCGRQTPITGSDYASKQVAMAGAAIGAMAVGGIAGGSALAQYGALRVVPNELGQFSGTLNDGITRSIDARGRYHDVSTGRFVSAPQPSRFDLVPSGEVNRDNVTSLAANASRPAVASAMSLLASPPSATRSGSFQEGTGGMGIQVPYVIINRPKMSMPDGYGHHYGYPSNIYSKLGSLSGYTEVASIHLDGISATSSELTEIQSLLEGGVVL